MGCFRADKDGNCSWSGKPCRRCASYLAATDYDKLVQQADNSKEKEPKMNTASGGRCRFTDEDGFCTNENMQGGGFRCFGAGCECREPIRGPKPAAPIQQAYNNKEVKTMKRPTYKMMSIKLADCKPHADAEAYSASTEDRAALGNSISETGVLSPIAVIPATEGGDPRYKDTKGWFVIDGIGRMNALIEAGVTETEAQVFDLGDLSVAEFVVCKNAMMRKVTTGTRVMAYLKCHEREVLAAADPKNYTQRDQIRDSKGRLSHRAVSYETARDKGWGAKEIAERIGVSKNDVLAGIELLKEVSGNYEQDSYDGDAAGRRTGAKYVQMDLFETMDSVMHGETPIRRWKAAASGKVSKVGGKAAADYEGIGRRCMVSLVGLWCNWQTIPLDSRGLILERFRAALRYLPEDFRAVIEGEISHAEAQRGRERKVKFRKGTRW